MAEIDFCGYSLVFQGFRCLTTVMTNIFVLLFLILYVFLFLHSVKCFVLTLFVAFICFFHSLAFEIESAETLMLFDLLLCDFRVP